MAVPDPAVHVAEPLVRQLQAVHSVKLPVNTIELQHIRGPLVVAAAAAACQLDCLMPPAPGSDLSGPDRAHPARDFSVRGKPPALVVHQEIQVVCRYEKMHLQYAALEVNDLPRALEQ